MKKPNKQIRTFSIELEDWLNGNSPKTLGGLRDVFAEKSFAITFILLMAIPALPLPTGGVTHVFEIIVMLMSFQMMLGFQKFWLPKKLQKTKLKSLTHPKTVNRITRLIQWFERHSKPRMAEGIQTKVFVSVSAAIIFIFTLAAFLSPPFSGLDTLPALGVVVVSLGILLEDIIVIILGVIFGIIGMALSLFLGDTIIVFIHNCISSVQSVCRQVIK